MSKFQSWSDMAHNDNDHSNFMRETYNRLNTLCQIPPSSFDPSDNTKRVGLISDGDIEEIAHCLRDLDFEDACDRPRTFAILYMMNRQDLLPAFKIAGRLDNAFPYVDRPSLPPSMRKDGEASRRFLELQSHVMSTACAMEKGVDGPHVLTESGDMFFKSLGVLGKGGEAKVDKVESKITKQVYARKRIHRQKDMNKDKAIIKRFENELQILKKLDHHHLVKVFASYTDRKYVAIIMKPVAQFDLKEYLKRCEQHALLPKDRIRFRTFYGCLANALAYLHDNKIRHKDIKPSNILLEGDEIFITDFGTAVEFDGDNSMTRGTVRTRTVQYQSPEVARGAKRGKPSDIWSLGVTFLEMTTILRGETLHRMAEFLKRNGTKDAFVFENPSGALQWTEHLRKKTAYPRIDNSPMQWIKDMLEQQASDRPTATDLADSIKQSEGGFCGRCCRSDNSDSSDSDSSDSDSDETDAPVDQDIASEDPPQIPMPVVTSEPTSMAQTKRPPMETRTITTDPDSSNSNSKKPALHTQIFKAISGYVPRFRSIKISTPDSSARASSIPSINSAAQQLPQLFDQYQLNIPGSFPGHQTDIHDSAGYIKHGTDEQEFKTDDLKVVNYTPTPLFGVIIENSIDPQSSSFLSTETDKSSGFSDKELAHEPYYPVHTGDIPELEGCSVSHPLSGITLSDDVPPHAHDFAMALDPPKRINSDLVPLLLRPSRILERSQSDEHLAIRNQAKSLLEDLNTEHISESPGFQCNQRRFSLHVIDNGFMDDQHRGPIIADLMEWKLQWSRPSILTETHRPLEMPTEESSEIIPPNPALISDDIISPHDAPPDVEELARVLSEPANCVKNSSGDDPRMTTNQNPAAPDSLMLPEQTIKSTGRLPQPPNLHSEVQTNKNPLKTMLFNARNPTRRLTGKNLEALNSSKMEPKALKPPPFSIQKASMYRKKVFDDTASSVPTSIMSVRTKNKLTSFGLMLPLQDRTTDFMGTYTKEGKAAAVRMLLKSGCNPGTKREPRTAPIFNTVRGASSRHTKCLRLLVEYGVDVNVKANRTGKTPLLVAIENEEWSDYVKVIFLLVKGKANPNIADRAGDVPLLRLLGGGLKPLGDSQREALALLLCTPNIQVGVTLPGTRNRPLHLAIRRSDHLAVGMLLEKDDTTIEAENSEALTPLLLAATFWKSGMTPDKLKILDLLLEKGANVKKMMPETRKTALHIAVSHGLVDGVERLLAHGADPKMRTSDGKSAHDLAVVRKKQHRCVDCDDCLTIGNLLATNLAVG